VALYVLNLVGAYDKTVGGSSRVAILQSVESPSFPKVLQSIAKTELYIPNVSPQAYFVPEEKLGRYFKVASQVYQDTKLRHVKDLTESLGEDLLKEMRGGMGWPEPKVL
jgi:hypothetical protein